MKAKQEDLDAINACIEDRWIPMSKEQNSFANCELCDLDDERTGGYSEGECENCVIMRTTGQRWCVDTPYMEWREARRENSFKDDPEKIRLAAAREVEFLVAIRDSLEIEDV